MSEEATSYVFAWHALSDCCPKCRRLNGQEFHDQDIHQQVLWSPFEGDVWDLTADHSLAHPNCRCQLEVRIHINLNAIDSYSDLVDLLEMLSG